MSVGFIVLLHENKKKNELFHVAANGANYQKRANVYTVHSIQLKFDTYFKAHSSTYCISFRDFKIYNFFTGEEKKFLCIKTYEIKILKVC